LPGLNLSRRTLDGLLKYPWAYGERADYPNKWGYYQTEKELFDWVRVERGPQQRSLTAEIMDWADDITFAVHDLIDFYCAGRIPIDRCKGEVSAEREKLVEGMFLRKPKWLKERSAYVEALESIIDQFRFQPDRQFTDSPTDRAKVYEFSTSLIRHYVGSIHILKSPVPDSSSLVQVDGEARREVEVLKQFIWQFVIKNPNLALPQEGQRTAIRTVFDRLLQAATRKDYHLFPSAYQDTILAARKCEERVRVVSDCVSGMTEKEIIHFYRCLVGLSG
jgi:dGTPase